MQRDNNTCVMSFGQFEKKGLDILDQNFEGRKDTVHAWEREWQKKRMRLKTNYKNRVMSMLLSVSLIVRWHVQLFIIIIFFSPFPMHSHFLSSLWNIGPKYLTLLFFNCMQDVTPVLPFYAACIFKKQIYTTKSDVSDIKISQNVKNIRTQILKF